MLPGTREGIMANNVPEEISDKRNTMTVTNPPYLTSIMTSRNDNYGGDALRRMQISIDARLRQLEKYKLESEFLLVEWNPPPGKPPLKDVIVWPERLDYCTIRIISVPKEIHDRYEYSEMIAINVIVALNSGIRRARGQFVLPGNIDLLYSDEVMRFFADRQLQENERYRIDRMDVDKNVINCASLAEQLEYARKHIIMVFGHPPPQQKPQQLPLLHTNASGDFQLMSRENWHRLCGYRESDIISSYADGLMCYASYAAGIREVILEEPMRLYHIDHGNKFNDRPQKDGLPFEDTLTLTFLPEGLNRFLLRAYRILLTSFGYKLKGNIGGIPTLHFSEYKKLARELVQGKRPYVFNDESWGLGNEVLDEYVQNVAKWDADYERN